MMKTKLGRPVRLIAVHPFGQKTSEFLSSLKGASNLQIKIVENYALPHHIYDYNSSYRLFDYSTRKSERIFNAHLEFYQQQLGKAHSNGETAMLLSGRYHEDTAPLCVATKEVFGNQLKLVSFDGHLDAYGGLYSAGSFIRWLVDNGHLKGSEISIIGSKSFSCAPVIVADIRQQINDDCPQAVNEPFENFSKVVDLLSRRLGERSRVLRSIVNRSSDNALVGMLSRSIRQELELLWVEREGVTLASDVEALPRKGNVLLSFDGDVTYKGGEIETLAALLLYFNFMKSQQSKGMNLEVFHISELDSPDCNIDMNDLASLFVSLLAN